MARKRTGTRGVLGAGEEVYSTLNAAMIRSKAEESKPAPAPQVRKSRRSLRGSLQESFEENESSGDSASQTIICFSDSGDSCLTLFRGSAGTPGDSLEDSVSTFDPELVMGFTC